MLANPVAFPQYGQSRTQSAAGAPQLPHLRTKCFCTRPVYSTHVSRNIGPEISADLGRSTHVQLTPTFETLPTEMSDVKEPKRELGYARSFVKYFDEYYLDGIIGMFVPAGGDVITGIGSMTLLVTALREGVPTVILFRMLLNILIDVLIGAIPLFGDIFDFFWRSNRRNLNLIERYRDGEDPSAFDYVVAGIGMLLALAAMAIPFLWLWGTYEAIQGIFGR